MGALPFVDPTQFDPADATRAARRTADMACGLALGLVREATYTAVGLGVLTFQRAQVRRREFERARRS